MTEKIAKELEVQAGDMITIRDEEKGDLKVKIKAVCENYMGHYLYMTADAYEAVYNENRSTMPFSIRRFQERQKKRKVSAKIFFSFRER